MLEKAPEKYAFFHSKNVKEIGQIVSEKFARLIGKIVLRKGVSSRNFFRLSLKNFDFTLKITVSKMNKTPNSLHLHSFIKILFLCNNM